MKISVWASLGRLSVLSIAAVTALTGQVASLAASGVSSQLSDVQASELQSIVDRYPDVLGGMWADPATHLVTIRIPAGALHGPRFLRAMQDIKIVGSSADPKAVSGPKLWQGVQFRTEGPSTATLLSVMARVKTAEPWASVSNASLDSWGIDPKIGKVTIGVDAVTPALSTAAHQAFGELAELYVGTRSVLLSRSIDSQPYYGSDEVAAQGGNCTVAFEAYNGSSQHGFLSAGHCFSNGATVYQGYYDSNGVLHKSGTMGQVTAQSWGNNVVDAEFINASVTGTSISDVVWIGPNPPCCAKVVTASGSSYIGQPICFDGSITGENCYGVVQHLNQCIQFNPYYECHLDTATASNGSQLATFGDSGGPVEGRDGGSGLIAYGTITGSDGQGHFYFSDLTYVLNALGVGLIVG